MYFVLVLLQFENSNWEVIITLVLWHSVEKCSIVHCINSLWWYLLSSTHTFILFFHFLLSFSFNWEMHCIYMYREIKQLRSHVWPHFQTPLSLSNTLLCVVFSTLLLVLVLGTVVEQSVCHVWYCTMYFSHFTSAQINYYFGLPTPQQKGNWWTREQNIRRTMWKKIPTFSSMKIKIMRLSPFFAIFSLIVIAFLWWTCLTNLQRAQGNYNITQLGIHVVANI